MSLQDPHLLTFLKVQLQISGAPMIPDTFLATLHYQMASCVQNHAFDLSLPVQNDALLISVDSNKAANCVHVPCRVQKEELLKLLPKSWVTNYEKFHQMSVPIQSAEPIFSKNQDRTVDIRFKRTGSLSSSPQGLFFAPVMMIEPKKYEDIPISSFDKTRLPIYAYKEGSHVY